MAIRLSYSIFSWQMFNRVYTDFKLYATENDEKLLTTGHI